MHGFCHAPSCTVVSLGSKLLRRTEVEPYTDFMALYLFNIFWAIWMVDSPLERRYFGNLFDVVPFHY